MNGIYRLFYPDIFKQSLINFEVSKLIKDDYSSLLNESNKVRRVNIIPEFRIIIGLEFI